MAFTRGREFEPHILHQITVSHEHCPWLLFFAPVVQCVWSDKRCQYIMSVNITFFGAFCRIMIEADLVWK